MPCPLSSAACQRQQQPPKCQPSRRRFVSAKGADGCEQHAAHTRTTGTVIGCRGSCNVLCAGLAKSPVVRPTARARGMDGCMDDCDEWMAGRMDRKGGWKDGRTQGLDPELGRAREQLGADLARGESCWLVSGQCASTVSR